MFEAYFAQDVATGQIYDEMRLIEKLGRIIGKTIPRENVIFNVTEIVVNTELRRGERTLQLLNEIAALGGRYDDPEDVLWVYFKRKNSMSLGLRGFLWIAYAVLGHLAMQHITQTVLHRFSKMSGSSAQAV